MEKKTISVHAFTVHIYTIAIAVLLLALIVLGLKYIHLKLAVGYFTHAAMWQQVNQTPTGTISDYAGIVATTVGQYPQGKPLYEEPVLLENYVTTVSSQLHRDVVVVDKTRKILADTLVANMGTKYSYDDDNAVGKTMQDGVARSFTETSKDYPSGLSEVVVPMKNDKAQIVGAVILSNTTISR